MSATGDFGPAPPGVNLAENQNAYMLVPVSIVAVIGTTAAALRLALRFKTETGLGIDDYFIIPAIFFSWGTAVSCFISIAYGGGQHLQALTIGDFLVVWKVLFAYVMIYATAVTCTKLSIVLFYRRVFKLRYSVIIALFLVIGYWVTIIVTINVACRPLQYFWTQYTDPTAKGVCIDVPKFFFGNGIGAMLIDVFILCIPIPTIWGLQMPKNQKLAVLGILLLGSFVCVASVVRIVTLDANTHSSDPTWTIAPVFIWSSVEPFIGIFCACLPAFAGLFRRFLSSVRTRKSLNSTPRYNISSSHPSKLESGLRIGNKKDWERLGGTKNGEPSCDEVELTNTITGAGSTHTESSAEERGRQTDTITVKQDVDVTWTSPRNRPWA